MRQAFGDEERALDDMDAFFSHSARFHELVVSQAGLTPLTVFSEITADLMEHQHSRSSGRTVSETSRRARAARAHRAHKRFLDIIESGTTDEAQQFWRDHLEAIGKYYEQGSTAPIEVID